MIAFWSYDLYPYLLSGSVSRIDGDRVYVDSYSGWFRPKFLLPDTEGAELAAHLKRLEREYKDAKKKLSGGFDKELDTLLANITKRR